MKQLAIIALLALSTGCSTMTYCEREARAAATPTGFIVSVTDKEKEKALLNDCRNRVIESAVSKRATKYAKLLAEKELKALMLN